MEAFVEAVIRRRRWVLAGFAGLTALALLSLSRAQVGTSLGRMFLGENPSYGEYLERSEAFGSQEVVIVGVEGVSPLSSEGRAQLRAAQAALLTIEGVEEVRSPLDAVRLQPGLLLPSAQPYAAVAEARPDDLEALSAELRADPLYRGVVLSEDGEDVALWVRLSEEVERAAEEAPVLVDRIEAEVEGVFGEGRVRLTGFPVFGAEVLRQTFQALLLTTPLVCLALLFGTWLQFGRLWPAWVSLCVAGLAAIWSLGLAVALDRQLHVLTAAVPGVVLIIAFSDVIHLCCAYMLELGRGHSKDEAVRRSCGEVGRACLFTSLTTFVGFICLSFVPVPAFRILGVVLGFGVGVALLLAVTLAPILFHLRPAPSALGTGHAKYVQAEVERSLRGSLGLALGRPRWVLWGFAGVVGFAVWGSLQLTIETDFAARLDPDTRARVDAAWFEERFVTAPSVVVDLAPPEGTPLTDDGWLRQVHAWEASVRSLEGTASVRSVLDLLAAVGRVTTGSDDPHALPARPGAALEMLLQAQGEDLRRLVDPEHRRLRVLIATHEGGFRGAADLAESIEGGDGGPLQGSEVRASGLQVLLGSFIDEVVQAQRDGLLISVVAITLLMTLGLGSLRIGLGSMIPNLLPLGILAACLGVFWDEVDSDAIALTYIALGIGVDDTIHVLMRLRLEWDRGGGVEGAIRRTFDVAGRGVVMTTVLLSLGFLPFLLSDYMFMQMVGSLLPMCFVVALIADIVLVPAMVRVGWLRFGPQPTEDPLTPPE